MAGVEYPTVSAMSGAHPWARPVTMRELTQFPSPGSQSVSASYVPCASRVEFVSLASGNFGSPYVVPAPTSPPSLTRMSVGSVPGSSSEGVCPSTFSRDCASDSRSSLEDQEVRHQLRQFHQMLEGLEHRLDHPQWDSSQPRQPVAAPPGFAALPLAESRPSPVVQAPVAPPAPPLESSAQPPAPFTMGQAREQRAAAASGHAATVTRSAPAVSAVAPVEPRVFTSVVLPSGTATVALPGWPQVPLGRGFLPASCMASAATQALGRLLVPRAQIPMRTPSPAPPDNPGAWQQMLYRTRAPVQSTQPRHTEVSSVHEHQPLMFLRLGRSSGQSPSLPLLTLPQRLRPRRPRGGSLAS